MIRSFVKNGRLMSLAIILLIVSGLGALSTMPRTEDPIMQNRHATVLTQLPGASAERIEVLITEKIEQKLRKISEIKNITSVSRPGISAVTLELNDEVTDSLTIWSRASIEVVNAVSWREELCIAIIGKPSASIRAAGSVRQINPRPWVAMKLIAVASACWAGMIRSPSFSRSS